MKYVDESWCMKKGQMKARTWQRVGLAGSIELNRLWEDSFQKGNRKGKINGVYVIYALDKLGFVVLNVVRVVHG